MDLGLKGRAAVVAGASKGLGLAVAKALGKEGARVAICSRDARNIEKAADELRSEAIEVFAIAADVSQPGEASGFVMRAQDHLGGIDILVTNAGGPPALTFETIDDETWEQGFRLNLMSTIAMIRTALPAMKAKRWGRIINMTSIAVKQPIDGLIISNTIRSGVIGLAKSLSRELAPFNITVNNLLPGYFLTSRVEELASKIAKEKNVSPDDITLGWKKEIPLQRLGAPSEFGALAAFLASNLAAYITGASIPIDGGYYRGIM
jgi:3-oxoacyl-[acyl-carrier protein] reductase